MSLSSLDIDVFAAFASSDSSDLLVPTTKTASSALLLAKDADSTNFTINNDNNSATNVNEFELNFLDEFLLHDEFVPDPHSPTTSDDAATAATALTPSPATDSVHVFAPHADVSIAATDASDTAAYFFEKIAFDTSGVSMTDDDLARSLAHSSMLPVSAGSPTASSSSGEEDQSSSSATEPLDRKAKRRAQVAISARRHRCRKKHELMDLRKEVTTLNAQIDALRSKHKMLRPHGAVAEWEERAMAQRHKRKQTEEQNEQLRRALFLQGTFLSNFKALFHGSALSKAELNMRQLLHTYTRLGTNVHARMRDYDAICSDAKLDLAIDVILRETAALDVHCPSITTRHVEPVKQEFGATTVTAYAFDTLDMRQIFVAACGAIRDSGREWPQYSPVDAHVQVVDAPKDNVRYGVSSIRYRSDVEDAEEVVVESRAISYYRVTDSYGVLLWDFVDDDDLYPLDAATTMKRDVVGAVLVRREVCPDGVERVVCRSLCTKIHSFSSAMPTVDIKRFAQSTEMGSEVCGSVVYNSIRNEFTKSLVAV